jgi:hypothetical protein
MGFIVNPCIFIAHQSTERISLLVSVTLGQQIREPMRTLGITADSAVNLRIQHTAKRN